MKYAVIGSRHYSDYSKLKSVLEKYDITSIVSGGAKGTDQLAERYALEKSISIEVIKPDWNRYGKAAGIIRNKDIINHCDAVIAFWDGISKGTKSTIHFAENAKKLVTIHIIQNK